MTWTIQSRTLALAPNTAIHHMANHNYVALVDSFGRIVDEIHFNPRFSSLGLPYLDLSPRPGSVLFGAITPIDRPESTVLMSGSEAEMRGLFGHAAISFAGDGTMWGTALQMAIPMANNWMPYGLTFDNSNAGWSTLLLRFGFSREEVVRAIPGGIDPWWIPGAFGPSRDSWSAPPNPNSVTDLSERLGLAPAVVNPLLPLTSSLRATTAPTITDRVTTTVNPDGTKTTIVTDGGQKDWITREILMAPTGEIMRKSITNNDGSTVVVEDDLADTAPYSQKYTVIDSRGDVTRIVSVLDGWTGREEIWYDGIGTERYHTAQVMYDAIGRADWMQEWLDGGTGRIVTDWDQAHQSGIIQATQVGADGQERITFSIIWNDNGTEIHTHYNLDASQHWEWHQIYLDVQRRPDVSYLLLKDGTRQNIDYDQSGSWSFDWIRYHLDSQGGLTAQLTKWDSGAQSLIELDPSNEYSWTRVDTAISADARMDLRTIFHDGGVKTTEDYDLGHESWKRVDENHDASGTLLFKSVSWDDDTKTTHDYSASGADILETLTQFTAEGFVDHQFQRFSDGRQINIDYELGANNELSYTQDYFSNVFASATLTVREKFFDDGRTSREEFSGSGGVINSSVLMFKDALNRDDYRLQSWASGAQVKTD